MASPQIEDGYTKLANELLEAIVSCKLAPYETCVLLAIARKTYGWGKKNDYIAQSQIATLTGIARPHVSLTVKRLVAKKIVTVYGNLLGIQKDYELWQVEWRKLPKQVTAEKTEKLPPTVTRVTASGNKKLPLAVHTKERKKLSKEISAETAVNNKSAKIKKMNWKAKKQYNENGHFEEPTIDADTGESLDAGRQLAAKEERELVGKIRRNLRLLESVRGLSFGTGKDLNFHVKLYRELLATGWSHQGIAAAFIDLCSSPHWKTEIAKGNYPGINTVQFTLRNKKPQ